MTPKEKAPGMGKENLQYTSATDREQAKQQVTHPNRQQQKQKASHALK